MRGFESLTNPIPSIRGVEKTSAPVLLKFEFDLIESSRTFVAAMIENNIVIARNADRSLARFNMLHGRFIVSKYLSPFVNERTIVKECTTKSILRD